MWCAALSSIFSSGAPFGQQIRFNRKLCIASSIVENHLENAFPYACMCQKWDLRYSMTKYYTSIALNSDFMKHIFCFCFAAVAAQGRILKNVSNVTFSIESHSKTLFSIIFVKKWCAALSSIFSSGAPFGQQIRFNRK